jgi:hypothetical protein
VALEEEPLDRRRKSRSKRQPCPPMSMEDEVEEEEEQEVAEDRDGDRDEEELVRQMNKEEGVWGRGRGGEGGRYGCCFL